MKNNFLNDEQKNRYILDFTNTVLREVFELIDAEDKAFGRDMSRKLVLTILMNYVRTVVTESLKSQSEHERTRERYADLKRNIQDVVAEGFTRAFLNFNSNTNDPVEFICKINPLDETVKGNS